jgi:hypothetical protein
MPARVSAALAALTSSRKSFRAIPCWITSAMLAMTSSMTGITMLSEKAVGLGRRAIKERHPETGCLYVEWLHWLVLATANALNRAVCESEFWLFNLARNGR